MSGAKAERRIAHVDMDAFFASVSLLRYPDLQGKPVVIGGRSVAEPTYDANGKPQYMRLGAYTGRGVVSTSTYEARVSGVFSAMGLMKAAQLAPDAYLLPADFQAYKQYSHLFKTAVATLSDQIENRGIDEIYVDLSHLTQSSAYLAQQIRERVTAATGLQCSVGISPNKLLSKIASELNKPNGTTILTFDDVPTVIWPLPVNKINGVGPKAYEKLQALGLETIGQVAQASPQHLQEQFGLSYAQWLIQACKGVDNRPLSLQSDPKSLSRETTFDRNLHVRHDRQYLSSLFLRMCEQLERDLQQKQVRAVTVGVKVRYSDFRTVTRDFSVDWPVHTAADLHAAASQALRRVPFTHNPSMRLFGVKANNLRSEAECLRLGPEPQQLSLYEDD